MVRGNLDHIDKCVLQDIRVLERLPHSKFQGDMVDDIERRLGIAQLAIINSVRRLVRTGHKFQVFY